MTSTPNTPSRYPQVPDEAPAIETPQPEPLLIHCPVCGAEISRYAPSCHKCGHPICPTSDLRVASPADRNQTIIIQQQPTRQSNGQSNGIGTAGFILALVSMVLSWLPGVGWAVWFLGLLFSLIGMSKRPRGLAIAGFIISIIDLIILVALVGSLAAVVAPLFS